jgi:hypothetical protein
MKRSLRTPLRTALVLLLSSVALVSAPAVSQAAPINPPVVPSNTYTSQAPTTHSQVGIGGFTTPVTTTSGSWNCGYGYTWPQIFAQYSSSLGGYITGCGFGVLQDVLVDVFAPNATWASPPLSQVTTKSGFDGGITVTNFGTPPCQSSYKVYTPGLVETSNTVQISSIGCLT